MVPRETLSLTSGGYAEASEDGRSLPHPTKRTAAGHLLHIIQVRVSPEGIGSRQAHYLQVVIAASLHYALAAVHTGVACALRITVICNTTLSVSKFEGTNCSVVVTVSQLHVYTCMQHESVLKRCSFT